MRAEAARLELEALALREQARLLDAAAVKAPLTIAGKRSMVGSNMEGLDLAGKAENVRTAANRTRRASEAKRLLLKADRPDGVLAKELRVGRSTVNAWFGGRRPIPRHIAAKLLQLYSVPLSAWPRIAD